MKRDVVSGSLLIAGALASVLVMVLHPTAHGRITSEGFQSLATLARAVHALALAATPVVFLGLLGAGRRLGPSDLATAGLVAYGFGSVAVLGAAVASGFVVPGVMERIAPARGTDLAHALAAYTHLWNQAFAKVHAVAFSVGMLLFAAALLRRRGRLKLAAATGIAGIVIGLGVLLALFPGHLLLDLHGARIVNIAQAAWLLCLGILLCRAAPDVEAA